MPGHHVTRSRSRARLTRAGAAIGILLFALAVAVGGPIREVAAQCNRNCPASEKDGKGCCKPRPVVPPRPTVTVPTPPPQPPCPTGQERSTDTGGLCCWPGQVKARDKCVGKPTRCPAGHSVTNASCELQKCSRGKERAADGIHCCWPGQGWRSADARCVGEPSCPKGFEPQGEECVSDDQDGDGIPNASDKCPNLDEDKDGFEDEDGCPEDNDRDGVADAQDRCPSEPEDLNRFEDEDGCPDEPARAEAERVRLAAEAAALREEQERIDRENRLRVAAQEAERLRLEEERRAPAWFDATGQYVVSGHFQYWASHEGIAGGVKLHLGAGPIVFDPFVGGGNLAPEGSASGHVGADLGVQLVSYPNWQQNDISFVNIDFGATPQFAHLGEPTGSIGPFGRYHAKIYGFVPGFCYRHAWFADGKEDNALSFEAGYAW